MKCWKQWEIDQHPRCREKEDTPHVWICKDPGAREIWDKSLASIELLLCQWDTDPIILHVLMLYLRSWQSREGVSYVPPRELEEMVRVQHRIGWNKFFEWWFSMLWAENQQRFYQINKSNRNGKQWICALIKKFWDTAWDLWEHRNGVNVCFLGSCTEVLDKRVPSFLALIVLGH
jgi:hypothetical protein